MALNKGFVTSVQDGLNEIKDFLSADLASEHLQPINEKKRKDLLRLVEGLLTSVYNVNPSLRPRMNTPGQSEQPKPLLSKPPLKAPVGPPMVPRTLPEDVGDDPQEEYLPMQPGSPDIEPEDYEAPGDVMADGTTEGEFAEQDDLYEELPAEDSHDDAIEPGDYEDPAASSPPANLNQVPLPPRASTRAGANHFEEPGYQPTGKPAEENTDSNAGFEPWQYAKTMRDKKVSTADLKNSDCKGMLEKLGGRGHNTWQKRYCILDTSLLYFFKDEKSKNFNNFIEAYAYSVSEAPQKSKEKKNQFCFVLTCRQSGKDYYFRTASSEDRQRWMNALRKSQPPSGTPAAQGPSSMHTLRHGGATIEPVVDDFQCECYEDIPAMGDQIQSEGESDEERFENDNQPKPTAPPILPARPPPPSHEAFDQDQLYDEHPVDEPEEEYLACENTMQQEIINSAAASPLEIVVDTNRIYEANEGGVDLEKVYVSLYDFNAEEDDEMSLQRGDLVCVVDSDSSPNWWLAELITPEIMKTNKKGYCPANFLSLAFEQL